MTPSSQNSARDWLKQALEFEEKGHDFYLKSAELSPQESVKEFFTNLAIEEKKHIETINLIYSKNEQNDRWPNAEDQNPDTNALNVIIKKLIKDQKSSQQNTDMTLIQAIVNAIELETRAESFYKNEIKNAECERERDFLKLLAYEENAHRLALMDLKLFLEDPQTWVEQSTHMSLDGA